MPLADGTSFEQAALIEPFSCVFNGQNIANVYRGDTVLVIGCGSIGVMHTMLAFSQGRADKITEEHEYCKIQRILKKKVKRNSTLQR